MGVGLLAAFLFLDVSECQIWAGCFVALQYSALARLAYMHARFNVIFLFVCRHALLVALGGLAGVADR